MITVDRRAAIEKRFETRLAAAGWRTYRDDDTGRLVTNAYENELAELQGISAISCEVVSRPFGPGAVVRIGPALPEGT